MACIKCAAARMDRHKTTAAACTYFPSLLMHHAHTNKDMRVQSTWNARDYHCSMRADHKRTISASRLLHAHTFTYMHTIHSSHLNMAMSESGWPRYASLPKASAQYSITNNEFIPATGEQLLRPNFNTCKTCWNRYCTRARSRMCVYT